VQEQSHTTEWVVDSFYGDDAFQLLKAAEQLVSCGYGSRFSWRKTKNGKKDALAITFHDVPVGRVRTVPDCDWTRTRVEGPLGRYSSTGNIGVIGHNLGMFGRVVGTTTLSRTPTFVRAPKKQRPQRTQEEVEADLFQQRVADAQRRALKKRPPAEILTSAYVQAKGMSRRNPEIGDKRASLDVYKLESGSFGWRVIGKKQECRRRWDHQREASVERYASLGGLFKEYPRRLSQEQVLSEAAFELGVDLKDPTTTVTVHAEGVGIARRNPGKSLPFFYSVRFGKDVYDPREESVRAQARGTHGGWGIAVARAQEKNPADIIQRSWERYQDFDHLIRGRQEYEIMLGRGRQSGPFRVVPEPTQVGIRYFVWPLTVGEPPPTPYLTKAEAEAEMARRYRLRITIAASLPPVLYTRDMLAAWLPPDNVFEGRSGVPSKASQRPRRTFLPGEAEALEPRRVSGPAPIPKVPVSTVPVPTLLDQYRAFDKDWYKHPALIERFKAKLPPPSR
jgi:hypothetical protein